MTVLEYLTEKKDFFSDSTWKTAKSHLERNSDLFLLPVQDIVKHLLERYKRNTAKQIYIRLRCFLEHRLTDFKHFEKKNPGVWRFSYIMRDQIPTSEDVTLLLNQVISHGNLWNAIILISRAGLRWSELFKVKWSDLEILDNMLRLTIYQSKGRKDRQIALPVRVYQELKGNDKEYVVADSSNVLRHKWHSILHNKFIPHSLRAYAITQWSYKTNNLRLIADQAGHSKIETTLKYIKWTNKDLEDLIRND